MYTLLITIGAATAFLCLVVMFWLGIQLLANHRLGERKQGCKGPVRSEEGEMLCCKGDGSLCDEGKQ